MEVESDLVAYGASLQGQCVLIAEDSKKMREANASAFECVVPSLHCIPCVDTIPSSYRLPSKTNHTDADANFPVRTSPIHEEQEAASNHPMGGEDVERARTALSDFLYGQTRRHRCR